ncbi:MAG: fumarylacetoacetase [Gaiellaceae bacterium]
MTGFGLEHLPYGVFGRGGGDARVGVRFEDGVLDLAAAGLGEVFRVPSLNGFMAQGPAAWAETRGRVRQLLEHGDAALVPLDEVELHLPFEVADYVDFYSSLEHATNLGRMFRPDSEPLLPNWRWLPVGYHGRAGTVVVSGTPVVRPSGQSKAPDARHPSFGPSRRLDIELELGFVVGVPSEQGRPVPAGRALDHVFGVVLVNDWSARDIQAWEYQPLGPFLGKSFATSISAWVTPFAALEPYRVAAGPQEPEPLEHLRVEPWALDLDLEVELGGETISRTSARHLYWTVEQQVAHATSNGASLRTGDLLASGTISGPTRDSCGSLIELTWNGTEPLRLADGTTRTFLEDGDEVVLRGRAGEATLGEVSGRIVPAV